MSRWMIILFSILATPVFAQDADGNVWLDCHWNEDKTSISVSGEISDTKTQKQQTYVYSKNLDRMFRYDSDSMALYDVDAIITENEVWFSTDYSSEYYKRNSFFRLNRKTLRGGTGDGEEHDIPTGDGRVLKSYSVTSGDVVCSISAPKPVSENKF